MVLSLTFVTLHELYMFCIAYFHVLHPISYVLYYMHLLLSYFDYPNLQLLNPITTTLQQHPNLDL